MPIFILKNAKTISIIRVISKSVHTAKVRNWNPLYTQPQTNPRNKKKYGRERNKNVHAHAHTMYCSNQLRKNLATRAHTRNKKLKNREIEREKNRIRTISCTLGRMVRFSSLSLGIDEMC